jgi:hypothetical protein
MNRLRRMTMKTLNRPIAMAVLGCTALAMAVPALAADTDECRGGYRVMLMTAGECEAFLKQLEAVRASGDALAELELREWHTALLIERAEACPCRAGEHYALYQRTSGAAFPRRIQRY